MTRFVGNPNGPIHSVNEALWRHFIEPGFNGSSLADVLGLQLLPNDHSAARAMRRRNNYPLTRETTDALGEGWDDRDV